VDGIFAVVGTVLFMIVLLLLAGKARQRCQQTKNGPISVIGFGSIRPCVLAMKETCTVVLRNVRPGILFCDSLMMNRKKPVSMQYL